MAEFVTRAENTRRLIVVVVCVIIDTLALAGGIWAFKSASDTEKGEKNPKSIQRLQAKVDELEKANRAAETNLIEFGQPVGWRMHAYWTTDRFMTGAINHEEMEAFLNDWAADLRGRAPQAGERESMKYGLLRRVQELKDAAERRKTAEGVGDADKANLDAFSKAVDEAVKEVDKTQDVALWSEKGGTTGLQLKRLFEELEKMEAAYLALAAALDKRIGEARAAETEAMNEAETAMNNASKKLLETIDQLLGPARDAKQPSELLKPGGVHETQRNAEKSGPESVATKETELAGKLKDLNDNDKRNRQFKTEMELRLKDLRDRINWFKHRREEAREKREPDGQILGVVDGQQMAYIDLLHQDRLFRGTKFRVYTLETGGVKIDKGRGDHPRV
jgi:hypothetical protein